MAVMTRSEFLDLLDHHGPDPVHWPAALRLRADRALTNSAELRLLLATEQKMAAALANLPRVAASTALRQAVLDIAIDNPRPAARPSLWREMRLAWLRWTAGVATATAAGLMGFVLGYGQMVTLPSADGEQVVSDDLVSLLNQTTEIDTADLEIAE
jgi:hypothetical protein